MDLNSVGSKKIVMTATIWTADEAAPTAVAQGTYILPPKAAA